MPTATRTETGKFDTPTINVLRFCTIQVKNNRESQEDEFCNTNHKTHSLFAVADGHGAPRGESNMCAKHLIGTLVTEVAKNKDSIHDPKVHENMCYELDKPFANEVFENEGSTLVYCILKGCRDTNYWSATIGNIGDSTCAIMVPEEDSDDDDDDDDTDSTNEEEITTTLVGEKRHATEEPERPHKRLKGEDGCAKDITTKEKPKSKIFVTTPHKPTNETEQARIKQSGRFVARGRVNACLAVSRAFGDFEYKNSKESQEPVDFSVSVTPDVTKVDLRAGSYIVLCSDGLTDGPEMSWEQRFDLIKKCELEGKSLEETTRELVNNGTPGDNVTVTVIRLGYF